MGSTPKSCQPTGEGTLASFDLRNIAGRHAGLVRGKFEGYGLSYITEDHFLEWISREFEREVSDLSMDASLAGDIGFDSIDMLNLIVLLEEATGKSLPGPSYHSPTITLRECYDYVANNAERLIG